MRKWKNLPEEAKQFGSLISFKTFLNRDRKKVPKYYFVGKRKLQILHTRISINCSSLNSYLFLKNMTESPACTCGIVEKFLYMCNCHDIQRRELFHSLSDIPNLNLRKLMYGDEALPYPLNVRNFSESKRF